MQISHEQSKSGRCNAREARSDEERGGGAGNSGHSYPTAAGSYGGEMPGQQPARPAGDAGPWRCGSRREEAICQGDREEVAEGDLDQPASRGTGLEDPQGGICQG